MKYNTTVIFIASSGTVSESVTHLVHCTDIMSLCGAQKPGALSPGPCIVQMQLLGTLNFSWFYEVCYKINLFNVVSTTYSKLFHRLTCLRFQKSKTMSKILVLKKIQSHLY